MATPFAHESTARLVRLALEEDRIDRDVTSLALVPAAATATAVLEVREAGVLCGLPLLEAGSPLLAAFPSVRATLLLREGQRVSGAAKVARLEGLARELLGLERSLLNFLQRLSGIATLTARCVDLLQGTGTQVQETRKTCPGWRLLDKYAVRIGGGLNHRMNLADRLLLKENHISFCGERTSAEACVIAVRRARAAFPDVPLEIEVENEAQFRAVLAERPDIIMLDGFALEAIGRSSTLRSQVAPDVLLEVSGGLSPEDLRAIADCGVDRVSLGALTHSVRALDLAMKIRTRQP